MKRKALCLLLALTLAVLCGCEQPQPKAETFTLKVAGYLKEFKALDVVTEKFQQLYPGANVEYEYIQNFEEAVTLRLEKNEDPVDLFITGNIQQDSPFLPYALDLYTRPDAVKLDDTFSGLILNFELIGGPDEEAHLYCVPLGGEVRGLYVNKTILQSVGLEVPKNRAELLAACRTLADAGYIPMHSNPGTFAQQLMYPEIANRIANAEDYQAMWQQVNAHGPEVAEMFEDEMSFMYTLMSENFYRYKYVENELGLFTNDTDESKVRCFLDVVEQDGAYVKRSDVGQVPFMAGVMSLQRQIEKTKEDYHSGIEYEFILSPVGEEDGGYAYLSPTRGIAVNKNSPQLEHALAFVNCAFTHDVNEAFAAAHNVIPNIKDAFDEIGQLFDIPANHISELGQVTFDYPFYSVIVSSLTDVSKGNNPKYMIDNGDGTYALHPLEDYMETLRERFAGIE